MHRPFGRLLTLTLALSGGCALSGCEIDAEEMDTWSKTRTGPERLGAYLADTERPIKLRTRAAAHLMSAGHLDQIMTSLEKIPADQQPDLLNRLGVLVNDCIGKLDTAAEGDKKSAAAGTRCSNREQHLGPALDLGYLLLERIPEGKARVNLVDTLLRAALDTAQKPENFKAGADAIILACGVKAPERTAPMLLDRLKETEEGPAVARLAALLHQLKDEGIRQQLAVALLEWVKPRYKVQLQSPEVGDALLMTRNPTIARFMLDAVRDPSIDWDSRYNLLERSLQLLDDAQSAEALYPLLTLVDKENLNEMRWLALAHLYARDPLKHLKPMITALPSDYEAWLTDEGQLRGRIEEFCKLRVGKNTKVDKEAVLSLFDELVDETSWIARTFAYVCISELDPDGAVERLSALSEDATELPGWTPDGAILTIGGAVKALAEN